MFVSPHYQERDKQIKYSPEFFDSVPITACKQQSNKRMERNTTSKITR